jgi:DNA-binding transcriptional MocR family regulator
LQTQYWMPSCGSTCDCCAVYVSRPIVPRPIRHYPRMTRVYHEMRDTVLGGLGASFSSALSWDKPAGGMQGLIRLNENRTIQC